MSKRVVPDWGKEVKKALIDRDMSIVELATEIGYSRAHVTNVINGVFDFPDLKKRICEYLGIPSN